MIRLGLIGSGKWGKNYIEVAKEAGAEVVWACGRDWRETAKGKVDALIVATPPESRAEHIYELISYGLPMMVEKPLFLSTVGADLVRLSIEHQWLKSHGRVSVNPPPPLSAQVPFLVNYQHIFSPRYLEIRDRVGGMTGLRCQARAHGPEVRSYSQLWDYGPHFLAMAAGCGIPLEQVQIDLRIDEKKEFEWRVEEVDAWSTTKHFYHGRKERPLVDAVRAFVKAVEDGGTDDWRFGVEMSLAITKELERRHATA